MNREKIIKSGYREYPPGPADSPGTIACFQKRVFDDKGTKYFIDIREHESFRHPYTGEEFPETYEYSIQLCNEKDEPINMLFFAGWDIPSVEETAEKLFATGLFKYYEVKE